MLTLALCHDSSKARTERQRSFDPHMAYLRTVMGDIRFAGPLAIADGAAVSGDDRLKASVFVLELTAPRAREVMGGDPYFTNGVWESIQLFGIDDPRIAPATPPGSFANMYAVFCAPAESSHQPPDSAAYRPHIRHATDLAATPIVEGQLSAAGALGTPPDRETWRFASIITGKSLDAVQAVVDADPRVSKGDWHARTWSIPLAVGSWITARKAG